MLESDVDLLKMPPKPFHQLPLDASSEVRGCESNNGEPSTSEDVITITSSNVVFSIALLEVLYLDAVSFLWHWIEF
ncbi:hypothetical protein V6N13_128972 [Hibiscus sabdariffa]|uniref:Uncharacterized protein n=1 Tax=Hibiscus sabdariffa TaxID=183260 RepID=A0ABR2SJR7_9ROSI